TVRTLTPGPQQEPSITRAKGRRDGRSDDARKRPRSYAGRTNGRLDDATASGAEPGEPGDEETTTMARATTAPVPVMTKNDAGPTGKSSGSKATAATKAAGAKTDTKTAGGTKRAMKAKRQLGGPWGASFEGV